MREGRNVKGRKANKRKEGLYRWGVAGGRDCPLFAPDGRTAGQQKLSDIIEQR